MHTCVLVEVIEWRDNPQGDGRSRWFRMADESEHTAKTLPIGAMFYDPDCRREDCKKPDGQCLVVKIPTKNGRGDLFSIDHPSSGDGEGWSRSGTPPNVTAHPSIHYVGEWHGWLRDGALVEA